MDKAFMEQMKKRVEKELAEKEISVVEFWKQELNLILHRQTTNLSALQQELQNLCVRMENRTKTLKKSSEF